MSGGEDPEGLEHPSFIIMPATETFDGQEHVMSRVAYELQVRATSDSVSCGHPGFVPDEYLPGPGTETTVTAAELCTAGMWERVNGGYRVLDWEAVEVCLDRVRQIRGEDSQALAWERECEAQVLAQMATAMVVTPGQVPAEWEQWISTVQDSIRRRRESGQWHLLFKGIAAYNGYGDPVSASRAGRIACAFQPPLCFAQVHTAGFDDDAGFCEDCDVPYCYRHWHVSEGGCGYCPRGHVKSLDRH